MNVNVYFWPEFLLQPLLIFHDDTSRWFTQHMFRVWPKLQISNFHIFFFFCFSLSVCGSYHKPEFLLQSLWWYEIWHADVSWPLQSRSNLGHHLLIFLIWHHYPRPVLAFGYCRCLRLSVCVCPSVCQSRACPRDNSWPVSARITKFGP